MKFLPDKQGWLNDDEMMEDETDNWSYKMVDGETDYWSYKMVDYETDYQLTTISQFTIYQLLNRSCGWCDCWWIRTSLSQLRWSDEMVDCETDFRFFIISWSVSQSTNLPSSHDLSHNLPSHLIVFNEISTLYVNYENKSIGSQDGKLWDGWDGRCYDGKLLRWDQLFYHLIIMIK